MLIFDHGLSQTLRYYAHLWALHEVYQAVDRRRLYCSSSCKVQACKAKRRRRLAVKAATLNATPVVSSTPTTPETPNTQTLVWNVQNIAVLGTAAALGNLGVKGSWKASSSLPPCSSPSSKHS